MAQIYLILRVKILELDINKLKEQLLQNLPGQEAQYLMAPLNRRQMEEHMIKSETYKRSAVMILFCRNEFDDIFIPLTERMTYNGAHSGQISLPGGKYEDSDGDLRVTAIRECHEEIGINKVSVIGQLSHLYIPVSNFLVQPFVGICEVKNPAMTNQEREVKNILRLSLKDLLNENIVKKGSVEIMGSMRVQTPYFDVQGKMVWGATAMMLSELKEVLKTIF